MTEKDRSAPFIASAVAFAGTPPLEFLAAFVDRFVTDATKRKEVAENIFGSYDSWLTLLSNDESRDRLETLSHADAENDPVF